MVFDNNKKLYEYDLHVHTRRFSGCSNNDPEAVLKKAYETGLSGIALTEHGIRWPDDAVAEIICRTGLSGIVVIPGQEAACYSKRGKFQGEFLVFGYPESLGSNKSAEELIEIVHKNNGVVIAAHPFKKMDSGSDYYGCGDIIESLDLDGLEIEHPDYDDNARKLALDVKERMGIAGIGTSDSHDLYTLGINRTVFEKRITNERELCEEIRSRRVKAVSYGKAG